MRKKSNYTVSSKNETSIKLYPLLWECTGGILCLLLCYFYPIYLFTIFDSRVFFTGITEVEREINFRTECGLYYSYYKQLVNSSSLISGLYDITLDPLTEYPSKINVLARMNIYQEVILAFMYRCRSSILTSMTPIFFYVQSIFKLQSILIFALFALPWFISKSWIAGLLCITFYFFNKDDATRVDVYMPLRECFALPFLWMQILFICLYFSMKDTNYQKWYKAGIFGSTFFFALFWQFNQFALFLQAVSLFICMAFHLIDSNKVMFVLIVQLVSILLVALLQFFNLMIFSGLLVSFIISSYIYFKLQKYISCQQPVVNFLLLIISIFSVALSTLVINKLLKWVTQQESDEHINNFVLTKFGFEAAKDFDVYLYLCNGGFAFIDFGFFERLTNNTLFPIYAVTHLVLLVMIASIVLRKIWGSKETDMNSFILSNPEWIFLTVQTVLFGLLAIMTMRMKYFWTPLMCIMSSSALADIRPWIYISQLLKKNYSKWQICIVKNSLIFGIVAFLVGKHYSSVYKELTDLREFYDPDTVELINWINNSTSPTASFAGSMQLMAGIKLSTGRPIANHPHYEDKALRQKTRELYCMYGRHEAAKVWRVLQRHHISYIILEDSICLTPNIDNCGLPHILDTADPMLYSDMKMENKRFCDEVRFLKGEYGEYFRLTFINKTFRVYQVISENMQYE